MARPSAKRTRHRLSRHFTVEEFDSRDGARVPVAHHQALEHLCHWILEPLREGFGAVSVHSGFRSEAHNLRVGGAKRSVHLLRTPLPGRGRFSTTMAAAADVTCAEGTPSLWAAFARAERHDSEHLELWKRGGVGSYNSFVHLDTGPARDWRG